MCCPSKLFAASERNREMFGRDVAYSEAELRDAEFMQTLGLQPTNPTVLSALFALRSWAAAGSAEAVSRFNRLQKVYQFLWKHWAAESPTIVAAFKEDALICAPAESGAGSRFMHISEVCWASNLATKTRPLSETYAVSSAPLASNYSTHPCPEHAAAEITLCSAGCVRFEVLIRYPSDLKEFFVHLGVCPVPPLADYVALLEHYARVENYDGVRAALLLTSLCCASLPSLLLS
jgi:hypothetical protein